MTHSLTTSDSFWVKLMVAGRTIVRESINGKLRRLIELIEDLNFASFSKWVCDARCDTIRDRHFQHAFDYARRILPSV